MLYYMPLEPYMERYTYLMSAKDGWTEDNFKRDGVDFVRIEGQSIGTGTINHGVVLDACGRSYYALSQIQQAVALINEGKITENDTFYLEDFWHPGVEALFYVRHLTGINFKIGTFCHAQSVDDTDFAYAMRDWMRPIEQGFGKQYDFIFVTSAILQQLLRDAGVGNSNIYNIGLPYNSTKLLSQLVDMGFNNTEFEKDNYVLFSSRFDAEKDPMFFLDLVERCPDIQFKLVKPRKVMSNDPAVIKRLDDVLSRCTNLEVVDTSKSKLDYYNLLSRAKVQFNCAHQDWVSWTLLEAITFHCLPLYPIWKDFPVELHNDERYLYKKQDLNDCEAKLRKLLGSTFDSSISYVVEKHDNSWHNYLKTMNLI